MVKKFLTRALALAACGLLPLSAMAVQGAEKVDKVSDIHGDISKYSGKQVQLKGEVEDIRGNYAFVLEGEGFLNDEILVVSSKPLSEYQNVSVTDGTELTAVGTIRQFTATQAEREMGWQLDPTLKEEWTSSQAVLVLNEINPSVTQPVAGETETEATESAEDMDRSPASVETDSDTARAPGPEIEQDAEEYDSDTTEEVFPQVEEL